MALIEWSDALEMGVTQVDAEHRRLVDVLNRLHAAMLEGRGRARLATAFEELVEYTNTHFASEERLMEQHAYPGLAEHRHAHAALAAQTVEMKAQFEDGYASIGLEVLFFLKQWLTKHILKVDRQYVEYLRGRGVT